MKNRGIGKLSDTPSMPKMWHEKPEEFYVLDLTTKLISKIDAIDPIKINNKEEFLIKKLQLDLHPKKLIIRKLTQGIDFVGYVLFLSIL